MENLSPQQIAQDEQARKEFWLHASTLPQEALSAAYVPAVRACYAVMHGLDMEWTAHNPVQGEASPKVIAYQVAVAAIAAAERAKWEAEHTCSA